MLRPKHLRILLAILPLAGAAVAAKDEDDNTDFLLNVFSDVGPILALFGEQFARQFLSETFTWKDHVIFACVPLGIVTAIAGAIRVQGDYLLRAFIGRARENYAAAEIDYLSSTSNEVCELFNGKGIIRTMGTPTVAQLIVVSSRFPKPDDKSFDLSCGIHTLESATNDNVMYGKEYSDQFDLNPSKWFRILKRSSLPSSNVSEAEKGRRRSNEKRSTRRQATWDSLKSPNLHLNATTERASGKGRRVELLSAVIVSLILQIGLLVIAGTTATLVPKYEPKPWGLPCYITGSVLLVMGMLACSVAIERSTEEYTWQLSKEDSRGSDQFSLFWVQRTQRVSDQDFGSHVIFGGERSRIVTSSRFEDVRSEKSDSVSQATPFKGDSATNSSEIQEGTDNKRKDAPWWLHHLPLVAVIAGGSGFTVQFIGLRGLPWPCAVSQLIAIMVMALIRALIRRRLGTDIRHRKAAKNYELDYLAIRLVSTECKMFDNNENNSHSNGQRPAEDEMPEKVLRWKVETVEINKFGAYVFLYPRLRERNNSPDTHNTEAQRVVLVRKRLGDLCKWTNSASKPALALARSIERFLDEFLPNGLPATRDAAAVDTGSVAGRPPQIAMTGCDKIPLPDISKYEDGDERIEWKIPFSCTDTGAKTEVKLLITKGSIRRWTVDLAGIEAVLSLWMANLEARNSSNLRKSEATDWRRAGVASNVDYCRILGEKRGGVLKRDVSWWVNNPEIYMEKEIQEGEGPDTTAIDSATKDQLKDEIKITIGFIGSSTGLGPTELKASDLLLQYSNADLATLTAQHLFTSFMWTIGELIPRQALHQGSLEIGENVKVQSSSMFDLHSNVGKLSGRKLNNVNLTRFVTYAEKQGLGTTDEILLCIIPTFSFYDRLPNDVVLGCDQPELKLPGSSRSKDQACAHYSYFLNWIHDKKGASLTEYISIAAVARTMEYIYLLALDLANSEASIVSESKRDSRSEDGESMSDEDSERSGSSDSSSDSDPEADSTSSHVIDRPIKSKISKELTTLLELLLGPFSDILERLLPFYELQGRKKTIVDLFTVCLGSSNGTTCLEQVSSHDFMDQIGFTDLHCEVTDAGNRMFSLERTLVKKGMARDIFGWTPFHYAAARTNLQFSDSNEDIDHSSSATAGILKRLKTFLEANPPTGWWLDNFNRSPVHIAAFSGNNGLLKELLDALPIRDAESAMTIGGRDGMKPLHLAAGRRHAACVDTLLGYVRSGIDVEVDVWKQSPIHTALVNRSYNCAGQLLRSEDFKFSLEMPDGFGRPLLFYLLGEGSKKKSLGADILLTHWDKFEAQHGDRQSVLHLAISFLNFVQLLYLIEQLKRSDTKQPDVNLVNKYGDTPLHLAVRDERPDLVECLMKYSNASPSAKNHDHLSPMMLACDIGDLYMIRSMSQNYLGSEIDGRGRTALHHAILNTKWSVDACAQVVRHLAGVMVNVDALDEDHCSPLHYAADTCNGVIFSILLESEANIELTDKYGRNMLHHAVLPVERRPECSRNDLLNRIHEAISPTAIDVRDKNGDTPLHLAISSNSDDTVFSMLSKGANPKSEDYSGMTPFMTACRYSRCHKFIKYVVEQSNMLESDVNKNQSIAQEGSSNTPYPGHIELESAKSDVNQYFKDFDINKVGSGLQLSALAWACHEGSAEVVEILLLAEAVSFSIQATNFWGLTPLHLALQRKSEDIVQRLVADRRVISSLGIAEKSGLTPIDFAIRKSNKGCLLQLLKHHNVGPQRFSSSQLEEIMCKHRDTESHTIAWHEWAFRAKAGKDIPFPIHSLAKVGLRREVEEFVQFPMNAFELDEDRWTPSDVAQWCGHVDLMHYLRVKESEGDFIRPPCRWPSSFSDLYENSMVETTACPSTNSSSKLRLDVKIPDTNSADEQFCYLRTKEAIPPTTKDFYFQVELMHLPDSKVIVIGFCQSQIKKNRTPGWDKGTWAYHSDDGGLFIEKGKPVVKHDENICKQGDVMGVGLNMETGGFYRTRNGKEIDPKNAFEGQNFRIGKLYPCIGIRKARRGDEFQFLVTLPGYKNA
ncbi:hypothetical protein KAF25_000647 [Fusarium avenaceum]|uniref:B30.2/SPRY domain-containing protein n=1 Tax=Fusarium avenaceum TaxID=40199 RepID=A0A9P7GVZ3_9HYPO|nr:hypothetical protein KAF25_000647 [Fusarium avenaceum]